jgi:hypothetical protein
MANVTFTVPNKNGSYDGDMVVKQYTSMTINAGDTVTTDQPCRGLLILVQGNCTINGTLSMKGRGALANPTTSGGSDSNAVSSSGLRLPFLTASDTDTLSAAADLFNGCGTTARSVVSNFKSISSNGKILLVTRTGAGDTAAYGSNSGNNGGKMDNGTTGTNHLGGGGQGGCGFGDADGVGRSGTCFSGGSGGGGGNNTGIGSGTNATVYGGQGGLGISTHTARCTGGAGNPNGTESTTGGYGGAANSSNGESGTGGLIWLIVGGNLVIGATGLITAAGSRSDSIDGNSYNWLSTGGGSGGGAVRIAYRGTFTNSGTISVAGGTAGVNFDGGNLVYAAEGGNGGAGTSVTQQVK